MDDGSFAIISGRTFNWKICDMIHFADLAQILSENQDQNIFVHFDPEILDFTDDSQQKEIKLHFQNGKILSIPLSKDSLPLVLSMLNLSLFSKNKKVLTWNWKNFVSYVLAKTGIHFAIEGAIIDLKILESYSGKKSKCPKNVVEALNRLKALISSGVWKEIESTYKKLHIPLITSVIPHLETVGVINKSEQKKVYAYYEIDGQDNGRLKCHNAYKDSFLPHTLKIEDKKNLVSKSDELFMSFDFKGMEVFVLAWLSKDPLLAEMCKQKDVYSALYEKIFNKKCEENSRNLAKKVFLPVIYGQSVGALAQVNEFDKSTAEFVFNQIYTLFPTALDYIESHQKQLKENGYARDIFGKRRYFEEGKEFSVRNFSVQSPAATVCHEKLIQLYFAVREKTNLAYSLHDGYFLYANKDNWQSIYKTSMDVLTSESQFCPELKLRVACRAGRNLDNLRPIMKKGD